MNWAIWFNGFAWGWSIGCILTTLACCAIVIWERRRKKKHKDQ